MFDVGVIETGIKKNGELVVGPSVATLTGTEDGLANTGTPNEDGDGAIIGLDDVGIVSEGDTRIGAVGLARIGTVVKGIS
jgi:hypothetical protein